jgi:hypothetical protein
MNLFGYNIGPKCEDFGYKTASNDKNICFKPSLYRNKNGKPSAVARLNTLIEQQQQRMQQQMQQRGSSLKMSRKMRTKMRKLQKQQQKTQKKMQKVAKQMQRAQKKGRTQKRR